MDYSKLIGERIISKWGKEGKITKVDKSGFVHVKFDGDQIDEGFLFDPFIEGFLKFKNQELQDEIDDQIAIIEADIFSLVNKCKISDRNKADFIVTLDNNDGSKEEVLYLNCSLNEAYRCFGYVISKQQKEYRDPTNNVKWRVVRIFNKDGKQIGQES